MDLYLTGVSLDFLSAGKPFFSCLLGVSLLIFIFKSIRIKCVLIRLWGKDLGSSVN